MELSVEEPTQAKIGLEWATCTRPKNATLRPSNEGISRELSLFNVGAAKTKRL
jgi:hypothetical protein